MKKCISIRLEQLERKYQLQKNELHQSRESLLETNTRLRKVIRSNQVTLKELEESNIRFRELTETTSDFIWEINRDGIYTYVSPKIYELLGYRPEDLLGTPSLIFRDPVSAAKFITEIEVQEDYSAGFSGWESSHYHKDGQEVIIESGGEPIIDSSGVLQGFRGIDRNITDRKELEERLRSARNDAEAANRSKSEFLANMSHELRTPLHAILSYSKFGINKIDTVNKPKLFDFFTQIYVSAKRLLPLINSLLDLSKMEAGKMVYNRSQTDVLLEVQSIIVELQPLAAEKEIAINIETPDIVTDAFCDRDKIGQVIRNILSNAISFSPKQGKITISFGIECHPEAQGLSLLVVTITDNGPGVPENELLSIFDSFVQSSKTKTSAGGTGLGLAICKKIILDHGGNIGVNNNEQQGSAFHFSIPTKIQSVRKIGEILIKKGLVSREDITAALDEQDD